MEIWLHAFAIPGQVAATARAAEEWGFAGLLVADSQNLTADIWVELALAGAATSRLRVGPGVTNPVTRHVAVTASAAATLQAETGGRCTLGFAQGDSALSQVGLKRLSVQRFERELANLQGLLRGESVPLNGDTCAIRWLAGVDLTLGAEPDRLRWGVELTRSAGPAGLSVGAYVNVAVDPDAARARELVRGSTATFARFSASSRRSTQLSQATRRGVSRAVGGYEEARHGDAAAAGARQLDDEFIDRFAVCGPAAAVVGRLREIEACGIDRLIVVPASLDTPGGVTGQINERFAAEVLPALTP